MKKRLAIGIATYLRPLMLERLLRSLKAMKKPQGVSIHIIIVDNDARRSAEPIVDDFASKSYIHTTYEVESRQGVSYARNRIVNLAVAMEADLLYCIDDDERMPADSLVEMLEFFESHSCEVATGPVVSAYPEDAPRWIVEGNYHNCQNFDNGAVRPVAATNNTLFDISVFREFGLYFDDRWAQTGGEDQHLTGSLVRLGGTIRWCSKAFVYEDIPMTRCTMKWLIRRQFRVSSTVSRINRQEKGWRCAAADALLVVLKSTPRAAFHFLLVSLSLKRKHALLGFRNLARGTGAVFGLAGYMPKEYKVIHGC